MSGTTRSSSNRSHRSRHEVPTEPPVARWMLALTDLGLVGVIFIAPLFMGGRYDVGRFAYVACVALAASSWAVRQSLLERARWRWCGVEGLILGGLGLLLLQLTPLPESVLQTVAPEVGQLLPLWTSDAESSVGLGTWNTTTLMPIATRTGLVTFMAHCLLFLVVVQRIRMRADVERMMRWLALAAVMMASLGLAQFLVGNGRFLWVYEHPTRDTLSVVRGSFQNQNHFAHFLILGLGPLIWWLQRQTGRKTSQSFQRGATGQSHPELLKLALVIGLGLVLISIVLTYSRGGIITALVALSVCLGLFLRLNLFDRKAILGIAGMGVILAGALAIYGYEPLASRLATLHESNSLAEVSRGRTELWAAHLKAIPQFLWTGSGTGSHREVYPIFLQEQFGVEFTHGENGYLHLLLENGVFGLTLAILAVGFVFSRCVHVYFRPAASTYPALAAVVLAGLIASLVHSLVDFVWYIPACLSLTIILAGCGCRVFQLNQAKAAANEKRSDWKPATAQPSRLAWLCVAVSIVGISAMMVMDRLAPAQAALHWDAYFRLSLAEKSDGLTSESASMENVEAMSGHLRELLSRDPYNARAHLRLAKLCLREFEMRQQQSENPMPLTQIRDAAIASEFADRPSLDRWLSTVLGENRIWLDKANWHTRRALQLCPLQGEGYVHLAELAFLENRSNDAKRRFIEQGLIVRPYSGAVLMAAGSEAFLDGDTDKTFQFWKRAFHQDPEQRDAIIRQMAPQLPPATFCDCFEPDTDGVRRLFNFYREQRLVPQALEIGQRHVAELVLRAETLDNKAAADQYAQAAGVYDFMQDTQNYVKCSKRAAELAPYDFEKRRLLARAFKKIEQYSEAADQLQWCLSRQPDDTGLRQELQAVKRLSLTTQQAQTQ